MKKAKSDTFRCTSLFFVEKSASPVSDIENMNGAPAHVKNDSIFGRVVLEKELSQFFFPPQAVFGSFGATTGHSLQSLNFRLDRSIPIGNVLRAFAFQPL
jgi:hypothetical protein